MKEPERHTREASDEKIRDVVKSIFGFEIKQKQLEALSVALRKDIIVIAKTGFGKSLLYQAAPFMSSPSSTVLIIMPLLALEDDQCKKLQAIMDCRPFVLKGDTNNPSNLEKIRNGDYTHGQCCYCNCRRVLAN